MQKVLLGRLASFFTNSLSSKAYQITHLDMVDRVLSLPVIFTLIVITQGCFGGNGVGQTPKRIENLFKNKYARFVFIFLISYTATSDIETAIITTIIFFLILHLSRTKEEKKEFGSYF